jgi:hypothetical protein
MVLLRGTYDGPVNFHWATKTGGQQSNRVGGQLCLTPREFN